jgi:hypothetical protein
VLSFSAGDAQTRVHRNQSAPPLPTLVDEIVVYESNAIVE